MDILKRIDEIRKSKHISIYKLAEKSGINRNTIYNWYSNNLCPSLISIQLICEKGFEMSLAEFFAIDSEVIVANSDTKEIFQLYATLNDAQKEAIKQIILSYKK